MAINLEDDEKLPEDNSNLRFTAEINDRLKRLKTGIDAQAEWADVVSRIADAFEHLSASEIQVGLAMRGFQCDGAGVKVKHRVNCPGCALLRSAKQVQVVKFPNGAA
jgi:hypothetical protein